MRYNICHMQQKKILIIEDSVDLAASLEDMLTFKGYKALKALNGNQGFSLAVSEKPDLILLDLKLPDIDGYDILRKLRAHDWGKTVRVLILTASDTSEAIPTGITVDPGDILHKAQWGIEKLAIRIESELSATQS